MSHEELKETLKKYEETAPCLITDEGHIELLDGAHALVLRFLPDEDDDGDKVSGFVIPNKAIENDGDSYILEILSTLLYIIQYKPELVTEAHNHLLMDKPMGNA